MVRRYGLLAALLVLFAMLTPVTVLADEGGEGEQILGRWDPSGVYISVTDGGGVVPQDTALLLTVMPADNQGKHYIGVQQRVNNFDAETQSIMGVEFRRTGRNTFDYELIMYSRIRDEEDLIVIKNAWHIKGVFMRNDFGEVWVTEQQMWFSPGCPNIIDPDPSCTVVGPIPINDSQFQSQLGQGGAFLGL